MTQLVSTKQLMNVLDSIVVLSLSKLEFELLVLIDSDTFLAALGVSQWYFLLDIII